MAVLLFRTLLFALFAAMLFEMGGWRWVADAHYVSGSFIALQSDPLIIDWSALLIAFNGAYYGIEQINRFFYAPVLEWFLLGLAVISAKISFCAGTEILSKVAAAIARGSAQHLMESNRNDS